MPVHSHPPSLDDSGPKDPEIDVYVKELSKLKYGYPLYIQQRPSTSTSMRSVLASRPCHAIWRFLSSIQHFLSRRRFRP